MISLPLSPSGATTKLAELYALPNAQLTAEAKAIRTNFKAWIAANFTLTDIQQRCLNSLPDVIADYYGSQCSMCFSFKLNIVLVDPGAPQPSGYGKWNETMTTTKFITSPTGDTTASGELTFTMTYKQI